jgi:hypothetical protein
MVARDRMNGEIRGNAESVPLTNSARIARAQEEYRL